MKTTIFGFYRNSFRKALLLAVLSGIISLQNGMAMPSVSTTNPLPAVATSPDKLRAISYAMHNSMLLMVHLENPAKEKVSIQILNSHNEVVYEEYIGKQPSFIGKYNLGELPNDDYTLVVESPSYTYSRSFSLQTFTKRVVKIQNNVTNEVKQEAI